MIVKTPPIAFGLGRTEFQVGEIKIAADILVKVRDFGVVSIIFQIAIAEGMKFKELIELAALLEEGTAVDEQALKLLPKLLEQIRPALVSESKSTHYEDYTIYYLEEFMSPCSPKSLLNESIIPALLLAEHQVVLSESSRQITMEQKHQYGENDLVVVEWNAAFVYEPNGGREVADILEFAVTHLLEMRYYDDLLDQRLKDLYEQISKLKRGFVWRGNFDRVYRESSAKFIEFTEFIERVENSLKVVGDFYLASVYRSATRKFRLTDWQTSVTRKIGILGQVSNLLQGEANSRRSHALEFIIVLLILYEIVSKLWSG